MYEIRVASSKVEKELAKIPMRKRERIINQIRRLAENPRPSGIKALASNVYRLRIGALLESCNLTWAGFENNIELAVRLEPEEVFDQLSLRDVMRPDSGQVSINDWKDFIHSLNKASRSSVTEAAVGKDGSWESFVQGLLAEGPPHLKTHLR